MSKFSLFTKIISLISILFLIYGYSCRAFDIYFFWEAKTIGWIIFKIALISFFANLISNRKKEQKKSILLKIGIGITVFIFIVKSVLIVAFLNSDAFTISKNYILSNSDIKKDIGEIKGFSITAMGGMQKETVNGVSSGNAEINFTIKAEKRYIDTTVWLYLNQKGEWVIDAITLRD